LKDVLTDDGAKVDAGKVADAIRPFVKGEQHKTEVLLDAREITWENVVQIQDGARAAGVQIVHHLMKK
jgi:biopolymer transport protein ExbD